MQNFSQNFDSLLNQLGTQIGWAQLGIVAAGFLVAWILARLVREKIPDHLEPGALKIGAGSVQRLVLPVLALVFIWLVAVPAIGPEIAVVKRTSQTPSSSALMDWC